MRFRLWAPACARRSSCCSLARDPARNLRCTRSPTAGSKPTSTDAAAGTRYRFRIDGGIDASRSGLALQSATTCTAPSEVVDPLAFDWQR